MSFSGLSFEKISLQEIIEEKRFPCDCGRTHATQIRFAHISAGATLKLVQVLAQLGIRRPFVVCDQNTWKAAGLRVVEALKAGGISHGLFVLSGDRLEPDEAAVGALAMAFDPACDGILAVGSGVLHDCCKVLAKSCGKPELIVATAPSMDGYASDSASMVRERVKVTLPASGPVAIIADTDVLCQAPLRMLQAGLGDMLAKYLAIFEWRLSNLVTGEWYCERVAQLVRSSLRKCRGNADRLLQRDPAAVEAVMEGLVLSGIAMEFAQCSRPASGLEHYFSHIWEMMALERHRASDLHGIQVGIGVNLTLRILERLLLQAPDMEAARRHLAAFDAAEWEHNVRRIFGGSAETLIRGETERYHKNDPAQASLRIQAVERCWEGIVQAAREELPGSAAVLALMQRLDMPVWPADIGVSPRDAADALIGSRDIRDKYLVSSLLWDLGLLDAYAAELERG